jgi:hypothetical protein
MTSNHGIVDNLPVEDVTTDDVTKYVQENIGKFHQKRINSLDSLQLIKVLSRKNPYLYKAKFVQTAAEVVKGIVDAHISSSEEGIFGEFLEGLAIYVCEKAYKGRKSSAEGIDLEFDKDGELFIVTIKSGPNWANSDQKKKMVDNFKRAKRILNTNTSKKKVVSVNGCCYGRDNNSDKGDYLMLCGQKFWQFVSGNANLYTEIIEPLGHSAREQNDTYLQSYNNMINKFTREFTITFCKEDGAIDWEKIVKFNSSEEKPPVARKVKPVNTQSSLFNPVDNSGL